MHHLHIDQFALGSSPAHRLDARAKLLAVLAYTAVAISFGRYTVGALAPLVIFPLGLLWVGQVPVSFALRRVAALSPLILMLALMAPWYDRLPCAVALGPWRIEIAGGWLTAADIALKFALTALAMTAVMATTPFSSLLEAMRRLGMPRLLATQLGFLYRYIFVLTDQGMRVRRARDFRGAAGAPVRRRLAAVGGIVGSLFVRTLERSQRIGVAMCARGYRGEQHGLRRLRFRGADAAFLVMMAAYLVACRWAYPAVFR